MSEHTKGPWYVFTLASPAGVSFRICAEDQHREDIAHVPKEWANEDNAHLMGRAPEVPHTCSDPTCPGNINRQKLELWGELVEVLNAYERAFGANPPGGYGAKLADKARSILIRAAAIPAPTQGAESG